MIGEVSDDPIAGLTRLACGAESPILGAEPFHPSPSSGRASLGMVAGPGAAEVEPGDALGAAVPGRCFGGSPEDGPARRALEQIHWCHLSGTLSGPKSGAQPVRLRSSLDEWLGGSGRKPADPFPTNAEASKQVGPQTARHQPYTRTRYGARERLGAGKMVIRLGSVHFDARGPPRSATARGLSRGQTAEGIRAARGGHPSRRRGSTTEAEGGGWSLAALVPPKGPLIASLSGLRPRRAVA